MDSKKKQSRYNRIYKQINDLIKKTDNKHAKMATAIAILHNKFDYFFWTGFYFFQNGKLIVNSYQGSVACIELAENTGVCWAAINQKKALIIEDVEKFPGHIACDSRSKSEIVIPIFENNELIGVFDVDSKDLNSFDEIDKQELIKIIKLIF